jgi:hypothetical protein
VAVSEIVNQFFVLGRAHIPRPHNFGSVNIGLIVDPLVIQNVVMGTVADNGELSARVLS